MNLSNPAHGLDSTSVMNAKKTLHELLGRAGVLRTEADVLISLVEAGAVASARAEVGAIEGEASRERGELYGTGWYDGARAVGDELFRIAERTLRGATAPTGAAQGPRPEDPAAHPPVGRMDVERAHVAVTALYLTFTQKSELEPEMADEVLMAVLGTMSARERVGYPGVLEKFAESHAGQLARLYADYGPGSGIAVHGRHSLAHSPTSIAVLERLSTAGEALETEWEAAELPPGWLDGLASAWRERAAALPGTS
ncbi:hypothetical protein [Streptomyces sp. NPDC053755]|uniref:hypothetical protein n=1 Tax=Streptomyces sp. NPDC053755 TaxID=3155815 RepID=UPI00341A81E0